MATFGDGLTDDTVKALASKYGQDRALSIMNLPADAPDSAVQGIINPTPPPEPGIIQRSVTGVEKALGGVVPGLGYAYGATAGPLSDLVGGQGSFQKSAQAGAKLPSVLGQFEQGAAAGAAPITTRPGQALPEQALDVAQQTAEKLKGIGMGGLTALDPIGMGLKANVAFPAVMEALQGEKHLSQVAKFLNPQQQQGDVLTGQNLENLLLAGLMGHGLGAEAPGPAPTTEAAPETPQAPIPTPPDATQAVNAAVDPNATLAQGIRALPGWQDRPSVDDATGAKAAPGLASHFKMQTGRQFDEPTGPWTNKPQDDQGDVPYTRPAQNMGPEYNAAQVAKARGLNALLDAQHAAEKGEGPIEPEDEKALLESRIEGGKLGPESGSVSPGALADAAKNLPKKLADLFYEPPKGPQYMDPLKELPDGGVVPQQLGFHDPSDMMLHVGAASGLAPLPAIDPEIARIVSSSGRIKEAYLREVENLHNGIFKSAGIDRRPFTDYTPDSPQYKAIMEAKRAWGDNGNNGNKTLPLTNGEVWALAMSNKIPETLLPPRMQQAVPLWDALHNRLADAQQIPPEFRTKAPHYYPQIHNSPDFMRALAAEKAANYTPTPDASGHVMMPYQKARNDVPGYSLDPQAAAAAYRSAVGKKVFDEPTAQKVEDYAEAQSRAMQKAGRPQTAIDAYRKYILGSVKGVRDAQGANGTIQAILHRPSSAWATSDAIARGLTPAKAYKLADWADKTQLMTWMRERAGLGYLADSLPKNGWSKTQTKAVADAIYTATISGNLKTAFNILLEGANTPAQAGLINTAKGIAHVAGGIFSRNPTSGLAREFETGFGVQPGHLEASDQQILDSAFGVSNRPGVVGKVLGLVNEKAGSFSPNKTLMAPLRIADTIKRGVSYWANWAKATDLAEQYPALSDPQIRHQFAAGAERQAHFDYSPAMVPPIQRLPLLELTRVLGSYPINQTEFLRELQNNPVQGKIKLGPLKISTGLARLLLVTGAAAGAGAAAGYPKLANSLGWTKHGGIPTPTENPERALSEVLPWRWAQNGTPVEKGLANVATMDFPGYEGSRAKEGAENLRKLLLLGYFGVPYVGIRNLNGLLTK